MPASRTAIQEESQSYVNLVSCDTVVHIINFLYLRVDDAQHAPEEFQGGMTGLSDWHSDDISGYYRDSTITLST